MTINKIEFTGEQEQIPCSFCKNPNDMNCEICSKYICDSHLKRIICTPGYHLFICPDCFKEHKGKIKEIIRMRKEISILHVQIDMMEDEFDRYLSELNNK